MRTRKLIMFLLCFMCWGLYLKAQSHKFYLRAISQNFNPSLTLTKGTLNYNGTDAGLQKVFNENDIYIFKKGFTHSRRSNLQRTWYIEGNSPDIVNQFLQFTSHIFDYGEYLGTQDAELAGVYYPELEKGIVTMKAKISMLSTNYIEKYNPTNSVLFFPNDYGATSPVPNLGIEAILDNFDFIGVPEAWDYSTGSSDIILGLSDGRLLVNSEGLTDDDPEFVDKTTLFYESGFPIISDGHGYGVAMRMAGQGNNGIGSTGICYDCPIYATIFGSSSYDELLEISNSGARVINCSWASVNPTTIPPHSDTQQDCINEIYENGTIIVAAAGNGHADNPMAYPASYDHVISVSGVGHKRDLIPENGNIGDSGYEWVYSPKYYVGSRVGVNLNATSQEEFVNTASINLDSSARLNEAVDILAPASETFSYGTYLINLNEGNDSPETSTAGLNEFASSSAAPQVSGTIGLMLDLNQCLSFEEVESILKITSTNIDYIPANQALMGRYGSGAIHTGRSVKLVNDLLDQTETAYLENQKFTRWDFEFKGVSEKIEIRNQEFTEGSTLQVVAKNRILIEENSLLEPNTDGNTLLVIDPALTIDTICGPPGFTETSDEEETLKETSIRYKVYPTKVTSMIVLEKIGEEDHTISRIVIYDLFNRIVYTNNVLEDLKNNNIIEFDLSRFKKGIYILKGYGVSNEELITEKIIKE